MHFIAYTHNNLAKKFIFQAKAWILVVGNYLSDLVRLLSDNVRPRKNKGPPPQLGATLFIEIMHYELCII